MDIEVKQSLVVRVYEEALGQNLPENRENAFNLESIKCAANLAHRGLITVLNSLCLGRFGVTDLSTIPTHHLASLVSTVRYSVDIVNVTGCDLVTIFDSLQCEELTYQNEPNPRLGREESKALGRAMNSRVSHVVWLFVVELDVEALTENIKWSRDLEFKCEKGKGLGNSYARELRRWAHGEGLSYEIENEEGEFKNDDFEDLEDEDELMTCEQYSIEIYHSWC